MFVLLQMRAVQVKLFYALNFLRPGRNAARLGLFLDSAPHGDIGDQFFSLRALQSHAHAVDLRSVRQHCLGKATPVRRHRRCFFENGLAVKGDRQAGVGEKRCGNGAKEQLPALLSAGKRPVDCGVCHFPDLLDRIPNLRKLLGFSRHQIGEIRLIIGIDSRHQLDITVVVISQVFAPGPPKFTVAPGPHFFPHRHVMVGHGDSAGVFCKIITAQKIHL